uniref:F-box domain-containing protein n=3 Tax=Aegilops tauschii subsp. strangulata TaxID=200361 RepID=A0A453MBQ2_AEGTS
MEAPPPPPALLDELVEEILLRLPPEDPACLLRASVVCKAWSGIASRPGFRRRLHELHGVPPVLGFLHNWKDDFIPRFISTTASSFSLAAPDRRAWRAVDCRHGRALFFPQGSGGLELLLWEPITGAQQRIPVPAAFNCDDFWTAAVLCAADGCDHRDCVGGPFRVVFLFVVVVDEETSIYSSSIYSSETGAWGELTSVQRTVHFSVEFKERYSVLVDRSVLYFMSDGVASCASVVEYDLASHNLTVFGLPDTDHGLHIASCWWRTVESE